MCEPQGPGEAVHVCPLGAAGPPHILRCVPENRKGEGCVYVGGGGGREGRREGGKGREGKGCSRRQQLCVIRSPYYGLLMSSSVQVCVQLRSTTHVHENIHVMRVSQAWSFAHDHKYY